MRSALAIIPLFALAHLGLADLDWNDIPNTCRDECTPVINAFTDCARQVGTDTSVDFFRNGKVEVNNGRVEVDLPGPDGPNDNGPGRGRDNNNDANDRIDQAAEQRYAECVCNKPNASTDIPNCSNCLVQNGYRDKGEKRPLTLTILDELTQYNRGWRLCSVLQLHHWCCSAAKYHGKPHVDLHNDKCCWQHHPEHAGSNSHLQPDWHAQQQPASPGDRSGVEVWCSKRLGGCRARGFARRPLIEFANDATDGTSVVGRGEKIDGHESLSMDQNDSMIEFAMVLLVLIVMVVEDWFAERMLALRSQSDACNDN
ncbi:hypothetical protein HDK77DRAFT_442199 [Phyllosticta capitalensis]|uniref:Uncharacterized protein n=1 Tax=Phyllosticta capitalensis TaxID=121624 RepID=A0ABR1Z4R5_9PEZI